MKPSFTLFFLGLLLEVVAFFGAQAENIPGFLNFILPKHKNASLGIKTLDTNKVLLPQDNGFEELHEIILNVLKQKNDPQALIGINVTKIIRKSALLRIGQKSVGELIPLEIILSDNQTIPWDYSSLKSEIQKLKTKGLFKYSIWIFIAGIIMMIFAFIIKKD